MKICHVGEVCCRQDVSIKDPKGGFGDNPGSISPQRPRTAEQVRFLKELYLCREIALRHELSDLLRMRMKIQQDFIDTVAVAYFQPNRQDWNTPNRHKTLGDLIRQGTQSRSMAGRQQKRFHRVILASAVQAG